MNLILTILAHFFAADGRALATTATEPLNAEVAAYHVAAAQLAGARHGVDPNILLAIADHESRYEVTAAGPEAGGRVSCGVMQPTPVDHCGELTIFDGYEAGAVHLRGWIDAMHGDLHAALVGYAGGFRMLRACAEGPIMRERAGRQVDLCSIADVFLGRARWIAKARRTVHTS